MRLTRFAWRFVRTFFAPRGPGLAAFEATLGPWTNGLDAAGEARRAALTRDPEAGATEKLEEFGGGG